MAKKGKSYDEIQTEIEKLIAQQEAMKEDKLNVLLDTFKREFERNKTYQQQVLKTDNAVLKELAVFVIRNFANFSENAQRSVEEKKQKKNIIES